MKVKVAFLTFMVVTVLTLLPLAACVSKQPPARTVTSIYVANVVSNTVSVIDGASNSVLATVKVGDNPFGVVSD